MAYFQLGSNWRHTQILQMQLYTPGNNIHGILVNLPQSCTFFAVDWDLIEGKKSMNVYASYYRLNTGSHITEVFSFQSFRGSLMHGVTRIKLCKFNQLKTVSLKTV